MSDEDFIAYIIALLRAGWMRHQQTFDHALIPDLRAGGQTGPNDPSLTVGGFEWRPPAGRDVIPTAGFACRG